MFSVASQRERYWGGYEHIKLISYTNCEDLRGTWRKSPQRRPERGIFNVTHYFYLAAENKALKNIDAEYADRFLTNYWQS